MDAIKPFRFSDTVRPLGGAQSGSPRVLIAAVGDDSDWAAEGLARWRPALPHVVWVALPLTPTDAWSSALLRRAVARQRHPSARLVVLGHGRAGGLALELVLNRLLTCFGFVGLDIPAVHHSAGSTNAKVRLVQHAGAKQGSGLADAVCRSGVDVRCMELPDPSGGPGNLDAAALRAVGTFLVELAAKACWLPS